MPITKLLPVHPTDHNLTQEKCLSLGNLHAQMYARDQPTTYPPGLHISRATDVKIVVDKVCPRLPIWDATKKKGFKLYNNKEIPLRKMKVETVNHLHNWDSLFSGKRLVYAPGAYEARTFWNQIVWMDTQKASTFGYDVSGNVEHHDIIQTLHPVRKYHFDNACVYKGRRQ